MDLGLELSILKYGSRTRRLKWRLPSGEEKVFQTVTRALKEALGDGKELKRILQMKKTSPTSFKKGHKEPLTD